MAGVTIKYFAWVRERIGRAEETLDLPDHLVTVADLVAWLTTRGPEYAHAFAEAATIRAALDQMHAPPMARIAGVREIALFPPVTGG